MGQFMTISIVKEFSIPQKDALRYNVALESITSKLKGLWGIDTELYLIAETEDATNVAISIVMEDRVIRTDLLENQYIAAPFFMQMEILNVLRKYHFMRDIPMDDLDKIY
ncbi:MAG: hypothetical protein WAT22_14690 [Saprospiraceae bacterium]|nr:hypothetical protein [Saprospiraceae bacterium]